ncbi:hypothetical protein EDC04DRAFT_3147010 [Pisolithus marmoratus]|nr:hypothetical protein EDC04DRAFT_3147010 [Pisolithus marmoratus]
MTVGCFSGFLCCWQVPSPSDDAVEMPVRAPTVPPSLHPPIHLDPPFSGDNAIEAPVLTPIPPSLHPPIHLDPPLSGDNAIEAPVLAPIPPSLHPPIHLDPPLSGDNAIEAPVLAPMPPSLHPPLHLDPPSSGDNAIETPVLAPMPPSLYPPIHLDPAEAKKHIDRIGRFRILVMGRANAGKTTILQRVCNTMDRPEIFDTKGRKVDAAVLEGSLTRGYHNIENELVFASNPGFVFHDSCGFEAGSEGQFESMKKFVMDRAKMTELDKRIHAIW